MRKVYVFESAGLMNYLTFKYKHMKSKLYIFLVFIGIVSCKKDSSPEEKKERCARPPADLMLIIQENENLPSSFYDVAYGNFGKDISIFLQKDSFLIKDIAEVALYKGNIVIFALEKNVVKYIYTGEEVRFLIKQAEKTDTLRIKGYVENPCGLVGKLKEIYFNDVELAFKKEGDYIVAFPKNDAI